MIYITSLDGSRTEPLYHIRAFEMDEILNDTFEIAFDSINTPENPGHDVIAEEAIVDVNGYKFRVKQLETTRTLKHVVAVSIYFDLSGIWRHDIYGGTRTFAQFIAYVFKDTGWTYEIDDDVTGSKLIANFGEDNVVSLTEILCATYECERKILPGKRVRFSKKVGPNNDAQYRYGHNVKALTRKVDTTQLHTRIKGIGADGLNVMYISPNEALYGFVREAEPYENEEYTVAVDLLERTRREIIDYPLISIEMDTLELTEKELGERVWLIYEPLGIKIQTRVLSRKTAFRGGTLVTVSVVLGNAKPLSMTDLLVKQTVDINEGKKQTKSRFEQTNEKITLAVERIGDAEASFEITADEIRSEVTTLGSTTASGFASQSSQISQLSGSISSKVSQTDYNGNTIASLINQTAAAVSIDASKINLNGYVTVSGLGPGGNVTIDSGRVTGSSFVVGNGTASTLTMTSIQGSHSIFSSDAAGFNVGSNGSLSLSSNGGNATFVKGGPLAVLSSFRLHTGTTIDSGTWLQANQSTQSLTVYGTINGTSMQQNGQLLATQLWVDQRIGNSGESVAWVDTYRIQRGGASLKFLFGSATIQARNYYDTAFGTFEGLAYSNASRRELKKDIVPFEKSALDLVGDTTIYNYRYNEDEDFVPKRVGLIFDEAPMEVMNFRGGVDIYAMASVLWKSVQELSEKVTQLQKQSEE